LCTNTSIPTRICLLLF